MSQPMREHPLAVKLLQQGLITGGDALEVRSLLSDAIDEWETESNICELPPGHEDNEIELSVDRVNNFTREELIDRLAANHSRKVHLHTVLEKYHLVVGQNSMGELTITITL